MHRQSLAPRVAAPLLFFLAPLTVSAVDDEAAFVEALRNRGEHELVLEYLAGAEQRGLTTDAFRSRLAYERVITRLDQVRTIREPAKRDAALEDAGDSLKRFAAESGNNRLAAEAEGRLAGALVGLARQEILAAEPIGKDTPPRLAAARKAIATARDRYAAAATLYQRELEKYKSVTADSPEGKERLDLRGRLAQVRLLGARTLHQQARSYPRDGRDFKRLSKQASEELAAFYEKYSRWLVGLYAHLYEGQCYLDLGETKLAAGCFEDLIAQPTDDPTFRRLITLAHASLVETRVADGKIEEAIKAGQRWYERLPRGEESGPDGLALAYQLASATKLLAEQDEGDRRRLLGQARQWFNAATRSPNEYREQARAGLADVKSLLGAGYTPPSSFAEAYQAVRDGVRLLAESKAAVKIAERNNPSVVEELTADIGDARGAALAAIGYALALTDDGTPLNQLNEVRSSQAFLLWESGDYLRAAVVGEFLATQYPDDPSAEQAANLALSSLQKLYQASREAGEDGSFEVARLEQLTESITKNLPGTRAASGAASVLVSIALNDGRIEDAQKVINLIPEAGRTTLQLQLASSVWEQSVRQLAEADDASPAAAERQKNDAAAMLATAVDATREDRPVSAAMATASLYLAQAKLDDGDAESAISILTDQEIGPLTLVDRGAEAVDRRGFASEAYKLALRSYVTLTPPRTDEALRTMKRLEEAVRADGGDAATQRAKLTRIYFGLGVQLQRQVTDLSQRGRKKQAMQLGAAFAAFLDSLKAQATDADWTTQQWIGQTYLQLADGLAGDDASMAQRYRGQARDVFQNMLERAKSEPSFPPKPNSLLAVRLQLGNALSKLGEHQTALDTLTAILIERPSSLEVQKAAAYALQEWGATEDTSQLQKAIAGARLDPKTKKNIIWGWNRLSRAAGQIARKRPQYKDLFFESWVNIVACRVTAAEQASGATRDKQIKSAKRSLGGMVAQYEDLGGPERRRQFDRLAKRLQKLEGEEQVGLKAFERK